MAGNGNSIQDMIAAAAGQVGANAQPTGDQNAAPADNANPAGITIERRSARSIEGRAKSGAAL